MSAFCTESAKLFKPDPRDRKSTRLNSSHTEIYTLSLHDALPISSMALYGGNRPVGQFSIRDYVCFLYRICQAIQTGSQNQTHARAIRCPPPDSICRFVNLFKGYK